MLTVQDTVYLSIETPLGKDELVLKRFAGVEALSMPFAFDLSMISKKSDLDFDAVVGQEATVTIAIDEQMRCFNGIIGEFVQGHTDYMQESGITSYTAKLYPKLWQLKFTKDCRIFQNQTTMDIVTQILQENGVNSFEDRTQNRGKAVREYCVQFNESCFDFVSRLMEEEGIFYFFEHNQGEHKLIMADNVQAYQPCPGAEDSELEMAKTDVDFLNKITHCFVKQSVISKQHDIADFNYETPSTQLFSTLAGKGNEGKVYGYPGLFQDQGEGEEDVKIGMEGDEWPQKHVQGASTIPFFLPGFTTNISGLSREDANKQYTLFEVKHVAELDQRQKDALYENSFVGFDASVIFRPTRRTYKPLISGTQTAFVTGKGGEEIWTDKYGRIKVQFHWDREGKRDEMSSCWVRVAQGWASNNWGVLFTPRIGQEVVVSFVNGDPDRPLVTGCVYNADSLPPYLPDEPTKSTIKTDSSLGGGGYNEIRFEDLKGSEEIYIQAEKDKNVWVKDSRKTDIDCFETLTVGKDRKIDVKGNETHTVDLERSVTVTGNESHTNAANLTHDVTGDESHTNAATLTHDVTGDESHTNAANFTHAVTGDYTLTVDGNLAITVTGDITINGNSVALKTKATTSLESGAETTIKAGADIEMEGVNINSKASADLKGEGAMIKMDSSGMADYIASGVTTVKGATVKVN
ncbi:MAG: type VI secretion system tip protein TssI/VgrG [Pseudomonadota bacterium]